MSDDVDYYALLGIDSTATSAEIRKAYRQKSLKVHPDRNPDNPTAAALFHELTLAADLLSDPTKRAAFDTKLAAANARKQRFAALDSKRKQLAEDLEEREQAYKRYKTASTELAGRKKQELERLKEEGRRMREARAGQAAKEGKDREDEVLRRAKKEEDARRRSAGTATGDGAPIVDLGPLDKTLKVKWLKARHPTLTTPDAVEAFLSGALAPLRPDIDSVVLSAKTLAAAATGAGPTKGKHGSGVVAFRTLSAAVRVVRGKEADPQGVWADFEVDWAAGSPPAALGAAPPPAATAPRPPSPPRAPSFAAPTSTAASDEDSILARLRQKEREKLMAEMRAEDEAEAAP
ncbi:hypothetical protein JCM9279_004094 [Rhodotorula babjevae]